MPAKNKSPGSETGVSCIYCGKNVKSTNTTPVQKSVKHKLQNHDRALSARIRRHKFMIEKLGNRLAQKPTLNPTKHAKVLKKKQKKRVQRDARMKTTRKQEKMLDDSELSPLYKGIILGLQLGSGMHRELISPTLFDQYPELRKVQSLVENLAHQSDHVFASPENLSQEPQPEKHVPVTGSPSQNHEVSPVWPNPTECPDETIDLTSIHTHIYSWSQLSNRDSASSQNRIQIEELAPSVVDIVPSQVPIQEDEPMLKPDEDPAQKSEVRLESEIQIGDGDCNADYCTPQSDQN